jgi:hypothetical protein
VNESSHGKPQNGRGFAKGPGRKVGPEPRVGSYAEFVRVGMKSLSRLKRTFSQMVCRPSRFFLVWQLIFFVGRSPSLLEERGIFSGDHFTPRWNR